MEISQLADRALSTVDWAVFEHNLSKALSKALSKHWTHFAVAGYTNQKHFDLLQKEENPTASFPSSAKLFSLLRESSTPKQLNVQKGSCLIDLIS